MTRQYWSNHIRYDGLITNNRHIACLLINNFLQPELPVDQHGPYIRWKEWIAENPLPKQKAGEV